MSTSYSVTSNTDQSAQTPIDGQAPTTTGPIYPFGITEEDLNFDAQLSRAADIIIRPFSQISLNTPPLYPSPPPTVVPTTTDGSNGLWGLPHVRIFSPQQRGQ